MPIATFAITWLIILAIGATVALAGFELFLLREIHALSACR